jgi:preprotein translocase SecE subunit
VAPLIAALVDEKGQIKDANKDAEKDPSKLLALTDLLAVPTGVVVVDRYALRDINERTDPTRNVRVGLVQVSGLKKADGEPIREGEIVPTKELDAAIERIKDERLKPLESLKERDPEAWQERRKALMDTLDPLLPKRQDLSSATGPTYFGILAQLPSVQYTFPLLLLAVSVWLSWRIVNMPMFADFLIATEAELNKVSWTTQRKLMQDTVVVLVTVVLMAGFLFAVDQAWRIALSWEYIKVLQIPKDQSDRNRALEQKNW